MLRVRMTRAMWDSLELAAREAGTTMSEFTRRILACELAQPETGSIT